MHSNKHGFCYRRYKYSASKYNKQCARTHLCNSKHHIDGIKCSEWIELCLDRAKRFSSTIANPSVNLPGTYTVVATNPQTNCSASAITTVTQDLTAPIVTAMGGIILCNTNGISLNGTMSVLGLTYGQDQMVLQAHNRIH